MKDFIPDRDNALNILKQGEERLQAAKELLRLGFYNDAISRGYYAMFSVITLLLYSQGKSYSSHKGLITAFHKEFIKTEIFQKHVGTSFSDLFQKRQDSDYKASAHFTKEEGEASVSAAEELMEMVLSYLKDVKPELLK